MATNIKGMNPLLSWLRDMLSVLSNREISIPKGFRDGVLDLKETLKNDTSGLASSILDFAINSALVNFYVNTDNVNLDEKINKWLNNINYQLRGRIPVGIKALSKEYYRERWKGSSFLLLRTIWEKVDGYKLPVKMWFVDGEDIHIKEDDNETVVIGEEKYQLTVGKNKYISLPQNKNELIFIQKPFSSWGIEYPTPFLNQRGVHYNIKLLQLLTKKGEFVLSKALEYLLLLKKGTEQLALKGSPEFIYSDEDLKTIKKDFSAFLEARNSAGGISTYATNFDTQIEHIIPEYKKALDGDLYSPIEKRILCGLGIIDIVDSASSTRRESILNPKPFISEINAGINDFKTLLEDVIQTIVDEKSSHNKYFPEGKKVNFYNSFNPSFISDTMKDHLRSLYDRGTISIRTYSEIFGMDFDLEYQRRKDEKENKSEDLFAPHEVQPEQQPTQPVNKEKVPPSKKGPEAKNFNAAGENDEIIEISKIVKRKDGYHVISEKTGKNLGGPYKTKKEAIKRLREVEYFKHLGKTEEEIASTPFSEENDLEESDALIKKELNVEKLEVAKKQKKLLKKLLKEDTNENL